MKTIARAGLVICGLILALLVGTPAPLSFAAKPKAPPPPPPPVRYRIQFWDYPNPGIRMMDMNNLGQVAGWYTRPDGNVYGILYDSIVDHTFDLTDDYTGPGTGFEGWRIGNTSGINDDGMIVGKIYDPMGGPAQGFLIDTQGANQVELLPYLGPPGTTIGYLRINVHDDILTMYVNPDGSWGAYFYNYFAITETFQTLPGPIRHFDNSSVSLNNPTAAHAAQVCGQFADRTPFLWTSGEDGGLQTFPGLAIPVVRDVNDAGMLCGETNAGKPSKRYPMRLGSSTPELLTGAANHDAVSINSSGDVLLEGSSLLLFQNGLGYLNLDNLVIPPDDPDDLADWFGGTHSLWFLNNRDSTETGFCQITGSIHIADGTNRPYILIPESPLAP